MATSRLPPATLTLKQFLRRQQVLLLYRRILQTIRQVPNDSDRKYLKDWAREEFKRNKNATEENTSKKLIQESDQHLENVGKILQNGYLVPDWAPKCAIGSEVQNQGPGITVDVPAEQRT